MTYILDNVNQSSPAAKKVKKLMIFKLSIENKRLESSVSYKNI